VDNAEIERTAIKHVMELEREARKQPVDIHLQGSPTTSLTSAPPPNRGAGFGCALARVAC